MVEFEFEADIKISRAKASAPKQKREDKQWLEANKGNGNIFIHLGTFRSGIVDTIDTQIVSIYPCSDPILIVLKILYFHLSQELRALKSVMRTTALTNSR